jgi:hypothetical protein
MIEPSKFTEPNPILGAPPQGASDAASNPVPTAVPNRLIVVSVTMVHIVELNLGELNPTATQSGKCLLVPARAFFEGVFVPFLHPWLEPLIFDRRQSQLW